MGTKDKPAMPEVPFLIFFDLDGVICNYDGEVEKREGVLPWEAKNIPGFFMDLKPLGPAIEKVMELEKLYPNQIRFLSTAPERPEAWSEKVQWFHKYFPDLHKRLVLTADKGCCGRPEDILFDDHPSWNGADRFGGTVIEFTYSATMWDKVFEAVAKHKKYDPLDLG